MGMVFAAWPISPMCLFGCAAMLASAPAHNQVNALKTSVRLRSYRWRSRLKLFSDESVGYSGAELLPSSLKPAVRGTPHRAAGASKPLAEIGFGLGKAAQ